MGKSRKSWQLIKKQIEEAWGKDFVKDNFKQDLGPSLDLIDADLDKIATELIDLEKAVDSFIAKKQKLLSHMQDTKGKMESYGNIVKNKSRAMKTKHGEQWDDVVFTVNKGFIGNYNEMNATLKVISDKLKKIVWVSG
jgi:hypothetical protein